MAECAGIYRNLVNLAADCSPGTPSHGGPSVSSRTGPGAVVDSDDA